MPHQNKPARLLVIPGLHGSGEAHWQTWLQAHYKRSRRVEQDDWRVPDLARWSARIEQTLGAEPPGPWIAVAHSFGCLALAHHLGQRSRKPGGIGAALLVAPADPARFGLDDRLPQRGLGMPATLLASDTDPWMSAASAAEWARRWHCGLINLGDVGHINVDAGFGPLPLAKELTELLMRSIEAQPLPAIAA
jgi:predicted alpha/beta hydrolase family esterase